MRRILAAALYILTLCAPALAETAKEDPNAITCHEGQPLDGMALVKGTVCKRNAEWARMNGGARFAGPDMEGPSGNVPAPPPPIRTQP